jgi:hypothetical protein
MNSKSAAWAIATARTEGLESSLAKNGNRRQEIFKLKATSAKGMLKGARPMPSPIDEQIVGFRASCA